MDLTDDRDLIFISLERWDDVWRRNQFVCAELARRDPASKILFLTPPRDLSNAVRSRDWSRLRPQREWSPVELSNITVSTPTKALPNTLSAGRAFNARMVRDHVRAMMRRHEVRRPVLWVNDHSAVHLLDSIDAAAVVYDITDDWTSSGQAPWLLELIRKQDAELCRRADAVIVCSQRLYELKRPLVEPGRLHLVPNGVDAAHYRKVLDGVGPPPAEAAAWAKPVFGYTGTVHPDRVDVNLIEAIARAFPGGTVVMIGPNCLSVADRDRLARCGNVNLMGPRRYDELPQLMRGFDACIVPHRMTAFTESLNPIKLWEYLAAGKPIVSTDVAGFRDYPQMVHLSRTPEQFIAGCREALQEDPAKAAARRTEAAKHAWSDRADEITAIMSDAVGRLARGGVNVA
jgi:teichuronic acid biosynthesis glycosyltransferase TuaH